MSRYTAIAPDGHRIVVMESDVAEFEAKGYRLVEERQANEPAEEATQAKAKASRRAQTRPDGLMTSGRTPAAVEPPPIPPGLESPPIDTPQPSP